MISDIIKAAVAAVWMSYDKETMQRGRQILEDAVEEGDPDAMCFYGRTFLGEQYVWTGGGFPESERKGEDYIRRSALAGSAAGVLCCMRTGIYDDDIERDMPFADLAEVFESVKAEADEGDAFCQYIVGNVYFWGDYLQIYPDEKKRFSSEEDYDRFAYPIAAGYFEQSFEQGLSSGFGNYRTIYESELTDLSAERVEHFLSKLALAGSPLCCSDYGTWLLDTYDDREAEAFALFKAAYEKGDTLSGYNLGTCYARGAGVEKDLDRAFELYLEAAEAGHTSARFHVGNFYFLGRGNVQQDYRQALRWLRKAYEPHADWRAAAELGLMYANGLGVPRDEATAFRYLNHSMDCIDGPEDLWEEIAPDYLLALGKAYAYGRGTEQDIARGVELLDAAIEAGSEEARRHRMNFRKFLGKWRQRGNIRD